MSAMAAAWSDAALAAALLAVDPKLGGACLRARSGPAQAAWLALYRALDPDRPVVRLPPGTADERLDGGLDLAATLAAGRVVMSPGLLAHAAGRTLVLPMAELVTARLAARLGAALDAGAGFTLLALDEAAEPGEGAPAALTGRLAFLPRLDGLALGDLGPGAAPSEITAARRRLARVAAPPDLAASLAAVAASLGIVSMRAPILALGAARAAAALAGSPVVDAQAAGAAARLVLGPRACHLPQTEADTEPQEPPAAPPETPEPEAAPAQAEGAQIPEELILEAALAAIPPDVVARLLAGGAFRGPGARLGGAGEDRKGSARGRPAGSVRGAPRSGARLDLVETLRAAAPWQRLRRAAGGAPPGQVLVRAEDFRVKRSVQAVEKVVIFAVDASGSTALARLGETKGAIELMLGQTYVARQEVAMIAFRGDGAELLLPPTRSLVLAKRRLAGLPGGGGTPLAAGLAAALDLARLVRRRGRAAYLALLTDGKANIALDGAQGRPRAEADAVRFARAWRSEGLPATVIDTSRRPSEAARDLAMTMGAVYLPLPRADARVLSAALGSALAGAA